MKPEAEKRAIRSILALAATGALVVGICTAVLSTSLFLDRVMDGARARIAHAADIGAISVGEFLRRSADVVWQVTSRSKARKLLAAWNDGSIEAADYRSQTERILGDALIRSEDLRAITRLDKRHRAVASVGERIPENLMTAVGQLKDDALVAGPYEIDGAARVLVAAPIIDNQGEQIGVDVTLFSLEPMARLLTPGSEGADARWELNHYLVVSKDGARLYYAPTPGRKHPIATIGAYDLLGSRGDAAALNSFHDEILTVEEFVFAARAIDGSDWLVLVRQSTSDLYGDVYKDTAVASLAAVLLSGIGAFGLLLLIRRSARSLSNELGGLRIDIQASKTRYADLIEGSIQGILVHRGFRPLLLNKAWADLHGYSVEEAMALDTIEVLIAPEDRARMVKYRDDRMKGEPAPDRYEYRAVAKDGRKVWVENSVRFIAWNDGPAIQMTIAEIGERKKREAMEANQRSELESLVQQRTAEIEEKSRSLETALKKEREYNNMMEQFVAMASHEFRTPLTIIDSVAQRLFRRAERMEPGDIAKAAAKTRGAVQRMLLLIESLLSSASMDAGKFKMNPGPCSLKDIVTEVCKRESEVASDHKIDVRLVDLPDQILGDANMLQQAFSNLLSNAVKYSPDSPNIEVTGLTKGSHVIIAVTDHGVGIPEEEQSKLFERFFRASTSSGIAGTGIGLNLTAQIIELHGGRIEVESKEGKGSTFVVYLPIRKAHISQTASFAAARGGSKAHTAAMPA